MQSASGILVDERPKTGPSAEDGPKRSHPSRSDDIGRVWESFADPASPAEFLAAWLALQCRFIPGARIGLLLVSHDDAFRPAAIWPDARAQVSHLGEVAERVLKERRGIVHARSPGGQDSTGFVVGYPLEVDDILHGAVVVDLGACPAEEVQAASRQLHWGTGWLEILFRQNQSEELRTRMARAALAIDVLAVAEEQAGLQASAIALVNELAKRLACDRVSLGLRRGRRVRLRAISHSAWFQRKSHLVGAIESAMLEALDQNGSVSLPPATARDRRVSIAHAALARRAEAPCNASILLRHVGRPVGVLTLERRAAFDDDTLKLAELIATMTGPLIGLKAKVERPIGGRVADGVWRGVRAVLGRDHPALKLGLLAGAAGLAAISLIDGSFRITARSVLEGSVQRAAVAPFNGYIALAPARAGDTVGAGQLLAQLDDADLRLERLKNESELQKLDQRRRDAQSKHDRASLGIIAAQVLQAEAELALVNEKLARTRISAPIGGLVVSGDLSQSLGSPIEQGKVLFEIAPLDQYRLVLQVDEGDIRHVVPGQTGTLALTGQAEHHVPFTIDKLTSVSTPQDGRNVFRVEARIGDAGVPLRPGMEGIGKVRISEEPLIWIWTRTSIARLRLLAWSWLP